MAAGSDHDIFVRVAAPAPGGAEMRVLLGAGDANPPDAAPRVVQRLVHRKDARVVRRDSVAPVHRDPVLLQCPHRGVQTHTSRENSSCTTENFRSFSLPHSLYPCFVDVPLNFFPFQMSFLRCSLPTTSESSGTVEVRLD